LPKEARRLRPLCVCWEEEDDHHHHHHHNDDYYEMDVSRWVVIYPVYINSKKTLAEGRRISTSKACDNPTVVEISDCCQYLKLPCAIEVSLVS
jgi:signal recognition particle subunit SRP19